MTVEKQTLEERAVHEKTCAKKGKKEDKFISSMICPFTIYRGVHSLTHKPFARSASPGSFASTMTFGEPVERILQDGGSEISEYKFGKRLETLEIR